MRPKERRDSGQKDLLRARLDQIVDIGHPPAKLARSVDWGFLEAQIGARLSRVVVDRGYRGRNAPPAHRFRVYISGRKRRVAEAIRRDLRRRSAVEPCIGHFKSEHRMGRNRLANAVLDAAGCNLRRSLAGLAILLRAWLAAIVATAVPPLDHSALA
jgi:IS5 family transposase